MAWRARTARAPGTTRSPCRSSSSRARSGSPRDSREVCGTSHILPRRRPSGRRTRRTLPSLSTRAAATCHVDRRPAGAALGQLVHDAEGAGAALRPQRAGVAAGVARRADGGPELHQRLVPVARPLAVEELLGAVVVRPVLPVLGAAQGEEAGEHSADVAVDDGQRQAVRDREDGARGVEAHAGHGQRGLERPREAPAVALGHVLRAAVEVARAVVVAEPRPGGEDLLLRLLGERLQGGEALQERLVVGSRRLHRGLLEHDLGDPDAVGVRRPAPRELAPVAVVPAQEGAPRRGPVHAGSLPDRGGGRPARAGREAAEDDAR